MKIRIHWNLRKQRFTVHSYKSCSHPDAILLEGHFITEWKPNKSNPRGFVVCDSSQITENPSPEILNTYERTEKLKYDKINMKFNFQEGVNLLCDNLGCYIVKKKSPDPC